MVCSPGFFKVTAVTDAGEGAMGPSVFSSGLAYLSVPLPPVPGVQHYNLYKNPDSTREDAPYSLYLTNITANATEVCMSGGYRITTISEDDGETPNTPTGSNDNPPPCAKSECADGYSWSEELCSCVKCDEVTALVGSPCRSDETWFEELCQCVPTNKVTEIPVIEKFMCWGVYNGFSVVAPARLKAPCVFSLLSGELPEGMKLDQSSSTLASVHGTPTVFGKSDFVINIIDQKGTQVSIAYSLTIGGITTSMLTHAFKNQYYFTVLEHQGMVEPAIITLIGGALPTGLTLQESGEISGTPTQEIPKRDLIFRVTGADGVNCARTLTLTVSCVESEIPEGGFVWKWEGMGTLASQKVERDYVIVNHCAAPITLQVDVSCHLAWSGHAGGYPSWVSSSAWWGIDGTTKAGFSDDSTYSHTVTINTGTHHLFCGASFMASNGAYGGTPEVTWLWEGTMSITQVV